MAGNDGETHAAGREGINPIDARHVTKPIQLLAAWLVGLIAVNGSFLTAATALQSSPLLSIALVAAAIVNVPLFLLFLFLLQTKFRPEMQEDSFYSRHLERKFSEHSQKMDVVGSSLHAKDRQSPVLIAADDGSMRTPVKASKYLSLNDLLPNFVNILKKLENEEIRPSETFGSTSFIGKPPKRFVISVGINTPTTFARKVIASLEDMGLEGVGIGDEEADADNIYVGAYSYDNTANFLPVRSTDFSKLMSDQTTDRAFFKLLKKYEHRDEDD